MKHIHFEDNNITQDYARYLPALANHLNVNQKLITIRENEPVGEDCVYVRDGQSQKWVGYMSHFVEELKDQVKTDK